MNWDEWCAYAAATPATPAQVGVIRGEWRRLWPGCDRDERLSACAALAGLDELTSTTALSLGDAGRVLNLLQGFTGHADLDAAVTSAREELALARRARRVNELTTALTAAYLAWQRWETGVSPGR